MKTETKTPKSGEYWFPKSGKPYLCIAANDRGDTVWQDWVDTYYIYGDDYMWKHWHHEFRCDSFDWVKPPVKRVPLRLWVHREACNDDRYNVFVKSTPPERPELFLEILHDADGFYVESPDE